MNFTKLTEYSIKNTTNGIDTDLCIQAYSGNILEQPFFQIELDNTNDLIFMVKSADSYFIYPVPQADEYLFTALYKATDSSPLARCYFIRKKGLDDSDKYKKTLESKNLLFKETNDFLFSDEIEVLSLEERKKEFLKRREEKTGAIKKIFDGRKTDIKNFGGIILQSEDCLICNEKITNYLSTTLSAESDLHIGFNVCNGCYEEATKFDGSNFYFLLNKFGIHDDIFASKKMNDIEIFNITQDILQSELNCKIVGTLKVGKKLEITALRKSGFKIIFRLQHNSVEKIDYAYMIFHPNGKQVLRFDSAGHHNDKLDVAPDHVHYDLENSNKKVRPSFLTGYLPLDTMILKTSIEKLEQNNL